MDEFLENFPSVRREDAVAILAAGGESLLDLAQPR